MKNRLTPKQDKLMACILYILVCINYWLRGKGLVKDEWYWADIQLLLRGYWVDLEYRLHERQTNTKTG